MIIDFRKNQQNCAQFVTKAQRWWWLTEPGFWRRSYLCPYPSRAWPKNWEKRVHFLVKLRRVHLPSSIFATFYKDMMESILTNCISVWLESCKFSGWKSPHRVVRTGDIFSGTSLPPVQEIAQFCLTKAKRETPPMSTMDSFLHWPLGGHLTASESPC